MKWWSIAVVVALIAGCSATPRLNSEPKYTTKLSLEDDVVGGVPLSKYSEAPRRNLFIYHFEAPPEVIFKDIVELKEFAPVRWDDNGTGLEGPGKGTIRWVATAGKEIREEIMEYDPPHMHFYQIDPSKSTFKLLLKNHIAAVTVEPDGAGGSLVIWRLHYDYLARPLSPTKKPIFNKVLGSGLDGLVKTHGGTRLRT